MTEIKRDIEREIHKRIKYKETETEIKRETEKGRYTEKLKYKETETEIKRDIE